MRILQSRPGLQKHISSSQPVGVARTTLPLRTWRPNDYHTGASASIQRHAKTLALLISAVYLAVQPHGTIGPICMSMALVLAGFGCSSQTLTAASFLLAPLVLGIYFTTVGMPIPGTLAAVAAGTLCLLTWRKNYHREVLRLRDPAVIWMALVALVLGMAYFAGPQSAYAREKLTNFALGTALTTTAVLTLSRGRRVSLVDLGILASVASVCYMSVLFYMTPSVRPSNILTTGGVRLAGIVLTHGKGDYSGGRAIAQLAGWSLAMLVGSLARLRNVPRGRTPVWLMTLAALVSIIALNSAGQRAALVALVIAAIALAVSKAGRSRTTITIAVGAAMLLISIGIYGVISKNSLIDQAVGEKESLAERVNRAGVWSAAVTRISEKPLLGHGLGGYYMGIRLDDLSLYPHNVFLELLVETGILGTILIVAPVVIAVSRRRPFGSLFATTSGESLMPFALYCFIIANMTRDLRESSVLFGICMALWPGLRRRIATAASAKRRPVQTVA